MEHIGTAPKANTANKGNYANEKASAQRAPPKEEPKTNETAKATRQQSNTATHDAKNEQPRATNELVLILQFKNGRHM